MPTDEQLIAWDARAALIYKRNVDPDSDCTWGVVCIGSKRNAYWSGTAWTYDENKAKGMTKQEAAHAMAADCNKGVWNYTCLVALSPTEYRKGLPTVNGY